MTSTTRIDVDSAALAVTGRTIFNQVTVSVRAGQSLALTGPSGCGKTSLLHVMSQLLPLSAGDVSINGESTRGWSERRKRQFWRADAAFIFQDHGLINDESVAFNVSLRADYLPRRLRRADERAEETLAAVGLGGRASEPVARLSGGERQRVGIARAIRKGATLIFADEPTASLDPANRRAITALLLGQAERGALVVIATHDDSLAEACTKQFSFAAPSTFSAGLPQ